MLDTAPFEKYEFYFAIYNLRSPSDNVKLGYSTMLTFESLPKQIQDHFLDFWKDSYTVYSEYTKTEDEIVRKKKASAFLRLKISAASFDDAWEKGFRLAKESVSILSFLYQVYFPIPNHCFWVQENGKDYSGGGEYSYIPSLWICEYQPKLNKEISKLTDILTNTKSEIDRKIRNALIIFETQTSVPDENVRFVLLTTCLESLLMAKSDRDYLRWKLSEKTAFLLDTNKRTIYRRVVSAYDKRSGYIHGSGKVITEDDVVDMQEIVTSILRRLMELRDEGYDDMEKVNRYIDKLKFGED